MRAKRWPSMGRWKLGCIQERGSLRGLLQPAADSVRTRLQATERNGVPCSPGSWTIPGPGPQGSLHLEYPAHLAVLLNLAYVTLSCDKFSYVRQAEPRDCPSLLRSTLSVCLPEPCSGSSLGSVSLAPRAGTANTVPCPETSHCSSRVHLWARPSQF